MKESSTTKEILLQTISAAITIGVAALGIFLVLHFTGNTNSNLSLNSGLNVNAPTATPVPYTEKNLMNAKVVTEDFSNSAPNQVPNSKQVKLIKVTGEIQNGYLYVIASAGGHALQTSDPENFDDIYANLIELTNEGTPESREHGGHLVAAASLETPKSKNETELLFPLSYIPYVKSYKDPNGQLVDVKNALNSDWLQYLNDKNHAEKLVIYSSTVKQGNIQKLIIYYTCKEGSDCAINITDSN